MGGTKEAYTTSGRYNRFDTAPDGGSKLIEGIFDDEPTETVHNKGYWKTFGSGRISCVVQVLKKIVSMLMQRVVSS